MILSTELGEVVLAREATAVILVEMAFVSETKRVWNGFARLATLDGKQWEGVGALLSIDSLAPSFSVSAPGGKVSISGASAEAMARAVAATEYRDRLLIIYVQPFRDGAVYGMPQPLAMRFMKSTEFARDAARRTIGVSHEGPYIGRRRPAAAWYSDKDQQKRHPGDTFCERVPYLLFKKDQWPHYI